MPAFSAVTVALGVAAHLTAGGMAPDGAQLILMLLVVALTWRSLARTEQSLLRLTAGVAGVQVAIHLMLGEGSMTGQVSAHVHRSAGPAPGLPSAVMLACHIAAGLLVAVWLRRGEATAWSAIRAVAPLIRCAAPGALCAQVPARAGHQAPERLASLVLARLGDRYRGPPLVLA